MVDYYCCFIGGNIIDTWTYCSNVSFFVWKLTLKAKIYISLKPTVSDPEGITIRGALHKLGFDNVKDVRAGKFIELDVEDGEESEINQQVTEMCQKLLSNPIIEDFNFEIQNT